MVPAADEAGHGAAGVRQVDLQFREVIEHAAENQAGGGDTGVVGIAAKVFQVKRFSRSLAMVYTGRRKIG